MQQGAEQGAEQGAVVSKAEVAGMAATSGGGSSWGRLMQNMNVAGVSLFLRILGVRRWGSRQHLRGHLKLSSATT